MKPNKCVQCGKGIPGSDGRCPVCGGRTNIPGLLTEMEGMDLFNDVVETEVLMHKEEGDRCISVELDYLTNEEYQAVLGVFRRVAAIAGLDYDAAADHYWVIQCWMNAEEKAG